LLLDEPFCGLDVATKKLMLDEIVRFKTALDLTLIVVSHDPTEVRRLCGSLAVLEDRQIADRGSLREVASNPRSVLARAFLEQLS